MSFVIDHVILGAPDLESGRDHVEEILGVRPALGGRHPQFGTHNALLSLGPRTYLEVIAPDPELDAPARGRVFGAGEADHPRVLTWMMCDEDIDSRIATARDRGLDLGDVGSGNRTNPDGTTLSWKLTDPFAMRFDGVVPVLIAWGETPHPATTTPPAGTLTDLRFTHPDADGARAALDALGVDLEVAAGETATVEAIIETPRGVVTLA